MESNAVRFPLLFYIYYFLCCPFKQSIPRHVRFIIFFLKLLKMSVEEESCEKPWFQNLLLKINKNRLLILVGVKQVGCFLLCGRRDSNPHAVRHQILSLARLPISPRPLNAVQMYVNFFSCTRWQSNLFCAYRPVKGLTELKILAQVNAANFFI